MSKSKQSKEDVNPPNLEIDSELNNIHIYIENLSIKEKLLNTLNTNVEPLYDVEPTVGKQKEKPVSKFKINQLITFKRGFTQKQFKENCYAPDRLLAKIFQEAKKEGFRVAITEPYSTLVYFYPKCCLDHSEFWIKEEFIKLMIKPHNHPLTNQFKI